MVPKNTLRHSDTSPEALRRRHTRSNQPHFTPKRRVTTCSNGTNRASCAPLWADLSLPLCPLNHPSPFPASWPSLLATAQSTMRRRAPSVAAGAAPGATLVRACCRRIGDSRVRREAMCCILWMGCTPRMCLWRQGCPPSLPWAGLQIPYSQSLSSGKHVLQYQYDVFLQ